jgi:glycosyltransferase involved in cell wall biosynthesis
MKILTLTNLYPPDFMGGYELACRQMADKLHARGHEVRILTSAPRKPVPAVPHVLRRFKLSDVYCGYLQAQNAPVVWRLRANEACLINAFNVHVLLEVLEDFQPEVVYLWHLVGLGGLGLVGALHHLRIPCVWHLMDQVPLELCGLCAGPIPALVRQFERQFRARYLACSRRVVEEIEAGGLHLNGPVEIVPNWVEESGFPVRTSYLQGRRLRVVSAAAWLSPSKGIDLLIGAAELMREWGHTAFSIDLFGRTTDPFFEKEVNRLRLDEHVHLQGGRTQTELARAFHQYDVFAFPTWACEPFGFAPLEAALHGCVPVVSQVCGYSEWFVHEVHCLKAERTAEAFARIFCAILEGKVDLAPLGRRARNVLRRDFHLDAIASRVERALQQAAEQSRAGAGTAAEAYHLAVLAEKLSQVLIQQPA